MDDIEVLRDKLADAVRQVNDSERTLQRYDAALDSITQLVWPEATDVQADAADYLTKLVVKVGVLARLTANDSQAWDVLRKHVRANHALSKLAVQQRDELRHLEAERLTLAARVLELEEHLEVATLAYSELRTRLTPRAVPVDIDGNGSPVVEVAHG